jgi:Flp pilus assembly CpaF family ATPase
VARDPFKPNDETLDHESIEVGPPTAPEPESQRERDDFASEVASARPISDALASGRTGWVSGDKEDDPEDDTEPLWSPQGRLVVASVNEGLSDPECTEIHCYGAGQLSARVKSGNELMHGLKFVSNDELMRFIEMLVVESAGEAGWRSLRTKGKDVFQMRDGSRLSVILPPTSSVPVFSIRKHTAKAWQPQELVSNGTLDQRMLDFLLACVAARVNILIVGEAGSGKTTLLRILSNAMGDNERIGVVEHGQAQELQLSKQLAMEFSYREHVEGETLTDILDVLLYFSLQRLIIGEIHFKGLGRALEMMRLCPGSLSTYHATSAEQAGERMRDALQVDYNNMNPEAAASILRSVVELVVVIEEIDGEHRVTQIREIDWRTTGGGGNLNGSDIYFYDRAKQQFKASHPIDEKGRIARTGRKYGVEFPHELFYEHDQTLKMLDETRRGRR